MIRRLATLFLLPALLPVALPVAQAAAGLGDHGSVVLPPEEDRELCRPLTAGQALDWQFESSLPIGLTAHYHRGQDSHGLWRRDELQRGHGSLVAEFSADYCLSWINTQERALTLRWTVLRRP